MRSVAEVCEGVFVATSRRETTTSTVVVSDVEALLVDPAWDPDELDELADLIDARGWRVTAGISTHAHHDHVLWHPRFGRVPRFASVTTVQLAVEHRDELVDNLGPDFPEPLRGLVGGLTAASDDVVPFPEPVRLVVHDGHAPGHTAGWLPERRVLIAGDMLSDVELPLPLWPDDLPSYLRGLDLLAGYVDLASVLIPGHGHATDAPLTRLLADRDYLAALAAGADPTDPRRANPGMAVVHERNRALAQSL